MKPIFISLSIICLVFAGGCNSFQTAYFGVEDEALHTPDDFGQTQQVIEKAKNNSDSLYAEKQIDKAIELGKTASITYWEFNEQEAKDLLALARQTALKAETFRPQPAPPESSRINAIPGTPAPPETIAAAGPSAKAEKLSPQLQDEETIKDEETVNDTESAAETEAIQTESRPAQTPLPQPETEAIVEKPETEPEDPHKAQYGIQVASLKQSASAELVAEEFAAKGYPVYRQRIEIDGVTWHRVRLGPYANKENAEKTLQKLKASGLASESFLIKEK